MKTKFVRALAALLTLILIIPAFPAYSADLIDIVDDSAKYDLFTDVCGTVYDVADPSGRGSLFSYDVPDDGAVILIFFNAGGGCHNSNALISGLSSTLWAHDDRFNIIAVDSLSHNRSEVASYLATYDLEGCVDRAYYNTAGAYLQAWYAEFIKHGGNMSGVNGFTSVLEFAHAIVITKVNGKPTIRYSVPNIGSITLLTSLVGSLFDIPEGENHTVEIEVPGVRRYDYVEDTVARTNRVRASHGKAPLELSARLTELAMERAEECAVYYSHERPSGYSCFSIGNGNGRYPGGVLLSENIAIGRETPGLVIEAWTNSEGHLKNMINEDISKVGIGCFVNNGHYFWVQIFGDGTDSSIYQQKGAVEVTATISSLESRLTVRREGRTVDLAMCSPDAAPDVFGYAENLTEYQQHISYLCKCLPCESYAYDADGEAIAKVERDGKITPLAEGEGTLELKLFETDGTPEVITVRVTDHAWDEGNILREPTTSSAGLKVYTCTHCSAIKEEILPKIDLHLAGDVNGDGSVDMKDVLKLRKVIAGSETLTKELEALADVDGDGNVNMKDVLLLRKILAGAA